MQHQNPFCQMCKKELCVVCKQKLDNCKCPCPNFVICRYCEAHEKTMPPCDDMFPDNPQSGFGGGSGGFGGAGGPMGKMMMPLMMMMMMNANKNGGGKSCECSRRSRDKKRDRDSSPRRDRDYSPKRDRDPPKSGHPCCCKTVQNVQPMPVPNYPQPQMRPACPQSCCTCSSRGDTQHDKCREPINQYFFGPDCNPQSPPYPTAPPPMPPPMPPQAYDGNWNRNSGNQPQPMNQQNDPRNSPARKASPARKSSPEKLQYSHRKPVNRKDNSIVVNKV